MKRIIVVYNPRSSKFEKVKAEVLDRIKDLKGFLVDFFEVLPTNFEDNVERLTEVLLKSDSVLADGVIVLAAGGDATAAIAANAVIKKMADGGAGDKSPVLAVLPYGNFNDLARTLGLKKIEDVFGPSADGDLKTEDFWSLEIMVDGEHFRYSSCYVTIGMMAEATEIFDKPQVRKELQKGSNDLLRRVRSYWRLAKWYFKNRKKEFLPEFELNGEVIKKATDYVAVNGASMAGVMRAKNNGLNAKNFGHNTFLLSFFGNLLGFMTRSILFFTPVKKTFGDVLEFKQPADIEMQIEGEYKKFVQAKKVVVKKCVQPIRVVVR